MAHKRKDQLHVTDEYIIIPVDEVEVGDVIISRLGAFGTATINSKKGKTEHMLTLSYTNGGIGYFFKGATVEKFIKKI